MVQVYYVITLKNACLFLTRFLTMLNCSLTISLSKQNTRNTCWGSISSNVPLLIKSLQSRPSASRTAWERGARLGPALGHRLPAGLGLPGPTVAPGVTLQCGGSGRAAVKLCRGLQTTPKTAGGIQARNSTSVAYPVCGVGWRRRMV